MEVRSVLPRDAIRSIDDPAFDSPFDGDPGDEVIVVEADPPRAYPIRVLSYHEIVNDTLDGRPIAVTWCPICWSAAVYDARPEGRRLTFGVSGKLADDALVMYDRETGSEWKQPTGRAIAGELEGVRLEPISSPITSLDRFREAYPDGVVLQAARRIHHGQPLAEAYDMDRYDRYVESDEFGLFGMRGTGPRRTWDRDDLDPKTLVLGIDHGGEAVGFPVTWVGADGGTVADTVGGLDIVVLETGAGVFSFEDPGFDLDVAEASVHGDGTTWDPLTGTGADGRQLERVVGRRLFAFAWQDAHGTEAFYDGPSRSQRTGPAGTHP